jgi:hypothetical protein
VTFRCIVSIFFLDNQNIKSKVINNFKETYLGFHFFYNNFEQSKDPNGLLGWPQVRWFPHFHKEEDFWRSIEKVDKHDRYNISKAYLQIL